MVLGVQIHQMLAALGGRVVGYLGRVDFSHGFLKVSEEDKRHKHERLMKNRTQNEGR